MTSAQPAGLATRSASLTLAAAILAGVQAVAIIVISKWSLSAEGFAPLAQLWAIWAVTAASFNYGFQQWAAVRSAGVGLLGTEAGQRLVVLLTVVGCVVGVTTFAIRDRLFASESLAWPLFAALLPLGTALVGLNRGELARKNEIGTLALVIGGENTIRLIVTIILASLGAPAWTFGAALLSGFAVAAFPEPTRGYATLPAPRPLYVAISAGLAAHVLLFGAPLILAASGGPSVEVVALFLMLSAVRAPFVLFQGLVPLIAVRFGADRRGPAGLVRSLVFAGVGLAVVAFGIGALAGDAVVGRLFSIRGQVPGSTYGLIGATAMVSVALAIVTIRLVASSLVRPIVFAWSVPVLATVAATAAELLDDLTITARWILACHLFAAVTVVAATAKSEASPDDASPDSLSNRPIPPTTEQR